MLMTKAVVQKVQADFPIDDQASVLEYLSLYGSRKDEPQIEEVRLAILKRAAGDKDKVIELVGQAKQNHQTFLT